MLFNSDNTLLEPSEFNKYKHIINNIVRYGLNEQFNTSLKKTVDSIETQLEWLEVRNLTLLSEQKLQQQFRHTPQYIQSIFYLCIHNKNNCNSISSEQLLIILSPYIQDTNFRLNQLKRICILFTLSLIKDATQYNLNTRILNPNSENIIESILASLPYIIKQLSETLGFYEDDDCYENTSNSNNSFSTHSIEHINWELYNYHYSSSYLNNFHSTGFDSETEFQMKSDRNYYLDDLDLKSNNLTITKIRKNSLDNILINNLINPSSVR